MMVIRGHSQAGLLPPARISDPLMNAAGELAV